MNKRKEKFEHLVTYVFGLLIFCLGLATTFSSAILYYHIRVFSPVVVADIDIETMIAFCIIAGVILTWIGAQVFVRQEIKMSGKENK